MTKTNIVDFPGQVKVRRKKSTPPPQAWYKRYPADFQRGTRQLSIGARGAYSDILDLLYMQGGPIPNSNRWIACALHITPRQWRDLRKELFAAGKLVLRDGGISNLRAEEEIAATRIRRENDADSTEKRRKSDIPKQTFSNEINGRDSQNQNHHQSQNLEEEKNHHLDAAREDDDPHGKRRKLNPKIAAKLTEIVGSQEAKHILSAYFRSIYARDAKIVDKAFPRWVEATYGHRIAEGMTLKQFNAEIRAMCQDDNGNVDTRLPKTPPRVRERT